MPYNQIKTYNDLLEIEHYSKPERDATLKKIFRRDIEDSGLQFMKKSVYPNKLEDHQTTMDTLYNHLTRKVYDLENDTSPREFDPFRSKRLHWIKDHIAEKCAKECLIFSCVIRNQKKKRNEDRVFIFNKVENYVLVMAPYRDGTAYYLLTAYYVRGAETSSIMNKYARRLKEMF